MADLLRTVALRGQLVAAVALPILLAAGAALAGGGILFAALILLALPLMLLLAVPPLTGRLAGKMRTPDAVPLGYAIVTVALWLAVLPLGFLMTYSEPAPIAVEPAGHDEARLATSWLFVVAASLWVAQLVLAIVGARARRRPAPRST